MALIQPQVLLEGGKFNIGPISGKVVMWEALADGDTCAPFTVVGFADKSIDISGDFGGGSIEIHGANHPVTPVFSVITDATGSDINGIATDKIKLVLQHTWELKPVVVGTVTDVDVVMIIYNHT